MTHLHLRILHETNPAKYFPALYWLDQSSVIRLVGAHRYSVIKEWLRSGFKDRTPIAKRTSHAWEDLVFRLWLPVIRNEVVVVGFAPWDWRLLIYRGLARRNRVIYHTSWHDWRLEKTPRQPRPKALRRWLRRCWLQFIQHPNVKVVAVTPNVGDVIQRSASVQAHIIPHAVPEVFFEAGAKRLPRNPKSGLKVLFVGEVSEKKGIPVLTHILPELVQQRVSLSIVGDGALANTLALPPDGVRYLGPIHDREKLASVMAEHDVLVVPSQRTETWEELFGIVIIEALATGLAVLASDHVGPRGILAPAGGAGLFDEKDHEGLRAALADFAEHGERLEDLQRQQGSLAQRYKIEAVAKAWCEVMEV